MAQPYVCEVHDFKTPADIERFITGYSDKNRCAEVVRKNKRENLIGRGAHGMIFATTTSDMSKFFQSIGDEIVIKELFSADRLYDVDKRGFYNGEVLEFIATNYVYDKLIPYTNSVFCMRSIMLCDDTQSTTKNLFMIAPKFLFDLDKLYQLVELNEISLTPENEDFIFLAIVHAIYVLQKKTKGMHRDLKSMNIFMDDAKKHISNGVTTISLDFGNGVCISFNATTIKYVPIIGDWGLANIQVPNYPVPLKDEYDYFRSSSSLADEFIEWIDILFLSITLLDCRLASEYITYVTQQNGFDRKHIDRTIVGNGIYNIETHSNGKILYPGKTLTGFVNDIIDRGVITKSACPARGNSRVFEWGRNPNM